MFINQIILVLDSDAEKSSYVDEFFKNSKLVQAKKAASILEGIEIIEEYEPDLIIIHDNFEEDIVAICQDLRGKTNFYRPIIMILSDSEDIDKKINLLRVGADDFQNESIDKKELSLRIFAHLRRHIDELTDHVTKLPHMSLSYRILRRNMKLKKDEPFALMYIDIDNFEPYKEIYGHIAAEKLLQSFIAIIRTSLDEKDFLGRVGDDDFIIFSSPEKSEKIAMFLSYYFDTVSPKFYNEEDVNRGYLIIDGDEKVGRRVPLMSISIGISNSLNKKDIECEELVDKAINIHKVAKSTSGSSWLVENMMSKEEKQEREPEKKILVIENDASLSYLLITTLEMQGYNVEAISSPDIAIETIEKNKPRLVLIDINECGAVKDLEICKQIKQKYSNIKVIVSTIDCNKEKILDSGVDLYIPKPYELVVLFNWVSKFLSQEVLH